jgi:hypothetical protein
VLATVLPCQQAVTAVLQDSGQLRLEAWCHRTQRVALLPPTQQQRRPDSDYRQAAFCVGCAWGAVRAGCSCCPATRHQAVGSRGTRAQGHAPLRVATAALHGSISLHGCSQELVYTFLCGAVRGSVLIHLKWKAVPATLCTCGSCSLQVTCQPGPDCAWLDATTGRRSICSH